MEKKGETNERRTKPSVGTVKPIPGRGRSTCKAQNAGPKPGEQGPKVLRKSRRSPGGRGCPVGDRGLVTGCQRGGGVSRLGNKLELSKGERLSVSRTPCSRSRDCGGHFSRTEILTFVGKGKEVGVAKDQYTERANSISTKQKEEVTPFLKRGKKLGKTSGKRKRKKRLSEGSSDTLNPDWGKWRRDIVQESGGSHRPVKPRGQKQVP